MLRVLSMLCVVSILCLSAYASDEDPFSVDLVCGWRGYYRPMEWTPVELQVSGSAEMTEPFAGSITVTTQQDGLNTMNITHEFVLTPEVRLNLPLVTKMAYAVSGCDVRITNERGRTQWQQEFNLYDLAFRHRYMTAVRENDFLIGLVGRTGFGLLRLPKQSFCQSGDKQGKVYVGDKIPRMVPWDWTGFVPLDILILYDPDWSQFKPEQLTAVTEWVSNGGKLLLVLGNHPLTTSNPITSLLPCSPRDRKDITLSPEILEKWGFEARTSEKVTAWSLVPKSGARFFEIETDDADQCLFTIGYAGFGRVGVLPFDPSFMSSEQAVNSALFWTFRIGAILKDDVAVPYNNRSRRSSSMETSRSIVFVEDVDDLSDDRNHPGHFEVGRVHTANNAVMEFLYQEIKPLSIWWVILLLIGLAVLLGPVDYKLLKHYGRLPLTWLTCTFWIILFTIGAYFGVQALRGGQLELRVVSVLDGIESSDHVWSTSYCGLFAPKSDDYRLKDMQKNQWWSGMAPTRDVIGMQGAEGIGKKIYCIQHDGGNLPYSLPVNIWDVQCLLNESSLKRLPFNAQVDRRGEDVVIDIINESKSRIISGYVLLDDRHGVRFGPVRAGATQQFRSRMQRMRGWESYREEYFSNQDPHRSRPMPSFKKESAFFAQGCLQRTQALEAYLEHGAAIVCVEYDQPDVSFALDGRSCSYNHVQLARIVVFPKVQ
ncbi:MAG: hypothetical protein JXM79_01645 [Sedimentisphaerales bacterium]|nr:hypothetical protein [Sedimentisphaerales bacterium]